MKPFLSLVSPPDGRVNSILFRRLRGAIVASIRTTHVPSVFVCLAPVATSESRIPAGMARAAVIETAMGCRSGLDEGAEGEMGLVVESWIASPSVAPTGGGPRRNAAISDADCHSLIGQ
jgi:hypothetical protein